MIAHNHRVAGAVTRTRLPQNAACRFPALRSSEVTSQHGDSLQLRVREIQLWSQQWKSLFDPMELLPPNLALPAPAAQHSAPETLYGPMDPLQCPDVTGNAVVRIVTAKHLIELVSLFPDRQVPHPPASGPASASAHVAVGSSPYATPLESCLSDCGCSTG